MMSQSRFASMHNGLSIAAKAIYEAVPIAEPWSIGSILAELGRTGKSTDYKWLVGGLDRLVESGLVNELSRGTFRRAPIRATPAPKPTPEPFNHPRTAMSSTAAPQVIAQVVKTVVSPLDKLGELAQRLGQLTMLAKTLGDDMTNVAIEVQEQFEAANADNAKLKQLQSILKSLGV
ncbi:MAG: hypothetical protein WKG03_00500 [Telluria sp.]